MASRRWVLSVALGSLSILSSCGGGTSSPAPATPGPVSLQSISVAPTSVTVAAGLTQQYSATGSYSDGSSKAVSVTWSTSNTALATISSTGLLSAVKAGSVTVSALSGTITGSTMLTVGPPNLVSLVVSPQNPGILTGHTQQFAATGSFSDGSSQDMTNVAAWSSTTAAIATISNTGLATGIAAGTTTIQATSIGISGSTLLTVSPLQLVSITVGPQNPTISTVQTLQFVATGSFNDGSTKNLTNATWSSGTPATATISNTGLATGVGAGTTTIQATSSGITGSTVLTVNTATLTYVNAATFSTGGNFPEGIVVADFNGDGKLDLAVSNHDNNTVAVFLNDGSGRFGLPIVTTVAVADNLGPLAVGDFNEDGKADLVVSTFLAPQATILLGNGDGTFRQQPAIPSSFLHAKVADFNGDGHQDLVFGGIGFISVLMGKGDGTFGNPVALNYTPFFPATFVALAAADFNGDGKLDIVALDAASDSVVFFSGNGDGTFARGNVAGLVIAAAGSLTGGDFNGDGKQDILIGFPNVAVIAFGNGDGSFDLNTADWEFVYEVPFQNDANVVTVLAPDLTNDGKPDAVTADYYVGTLQITFNSAFGQRPPSTGIFSFSLPAGIGGTAAGDLNGDGVLDVAVLNNLTSEIIVILSKEQ